MKLKAILDGEEVDIILRQDDDFVCATIGGRQYEIEASQPEPNVYLLKNKNRIFEVFVGGPGVAGVGREVRIGADEFVVKIVDTKRLTASSAGTIGSEGTAEVKTSMPGKIVSLSTGVGATVNTGDGLLVIEAMKMQNVLSSPKNGVVKEIRVSEGDRVNAGDVLVIIE